MRDLPQLWPRPERKYDFMYEKYEANEKQSCGAGSGRHSKTLA
jgi:hypothetical protein